MLCAEGGILVQRIQGDFNTVVGFPASAFYRWLTELVQSKHPEPVYTRVADPRPADDEISFDL